MAAVEMVKGIYELAERFSGLGEQLETASLQAGITSSEFQRLAYAASQNAVSQESLSGALSRMSRLLQHAKDGSEEAGKTFEKLGISQAQIDGFHNSRDAFLAVQDAISKVSSSQERLSLVQEIFGRGNVKLVKLMSQGSRETIRLGEEADRIGAVLSDGSVENLAKFEDAVSGFNQVVRTVMASLGAMFAPMLTDVIHKVEAFWATNQKLIKTDIRKWAGAAAYAFGFITEVIRVTAIVLAKFIAAHPKLVEEIARVVGAFLAFSLATSALKTLLGGVVDTFGALKGAASIAGPVMRYAFLAGRWGIFKLLPLMGSLLDKLGWVVYAWWPQLGKAIVQLGIWLTGLAANPVVLTIAGVVAALTTIVVLLHDAWALLHGKSFKETWMGQALEHVKNFGGSVPSFFKKMFDFGEGAFDGDMGDMRRGGVLGDDLAAAFAGIPHGMGANIPGVGTGALQGLVGNAMPIPIAPNLQREAATMVQEAGLSYSINQTININGDVTDPEKIGRAVKQAANDAVNEHLRRTHRDTTAAARH